MKKINQLIKEWPKGTVMTLGHLQQKGIDRELVKRYKSSGWLDAVGRGAYKLSDDDISLEGAVYALQHQRMKNIRIGARTALELKGYGHYISVKQRTVYLFSMVNEHLPLWFKRNDWGVDYMFKAINLFPYEFDLPVEKYQFKDFSIFISAPELAVFEMLYHIPKYQGFKEAVQVMESLTTLRPQILQLLLENCQSVKVKRVFLYIADQIRHAWQKKLSTKKIYLGSGKRQIEKNGVLDRKYLITVPKGYEY